MKSASRVEQQSNEANKENAVLRVNAAADDDTGPGCKRSGRRSSMRSTRKGGGKRTVARIKIVMMDLNLCVLAFVLQQSGSIHPERRSESLSRPDNRPESGTALQSVIVRLFQPEIATLWTVCVK